MKLQNWLSKQLSKISPTFIWVLLLVIFIAIILTPLIGMLSPAISKFGVDMFSPVSFRNLAYPSECNGAETPQSIHLAPAVAYAIGFVLLTIILIPLITNYLRSMGERYLDGTLDKYSWKNHVLFLGFDNMMLCTLIEKVRSADGNKVVIAVPHGVRHIRERLHEIFSAKDMQSIEVVQCNKCDKEDLKLKARICEASEIFIIGQPDEPMHDANNLQSLDKILNIVCDNKSVDVDFHCYIHIRNIVSFSLMQRIRNEGKRKEAKNKVDESERQKNLKRLRERVMAFNFYENIAGNLLSDFEHNKTLMLLDEQNEHKRLSNSPNAIAHLVILGMTQMGTALAREAIMVAHYPNHRLKITMVDGNAREEMYYFMGRHKQLFEHCRNTFWDLDADSQEKMVWCENPDDSLVDLEFEFIQGSIAHPKLMDQIEEWAKDNSQILTLTICTNDSPKNMATALYLPRTVLEEESTSKIHVWVYHHDDDSLREVSEQMKIDYLHFFSAGDYGSMPMAGTVFSEYVEYVDFVYNHYQEKDIMQWKDRNKSDKGNGKEESNIEKWEKRKKWEELSQYDRWSNLHNARSIIAKLRGMGYEWKWEEKQLCLIRYGNSCDMINLNQEEIEKLAVTEQYRWVADALAKGFRPTTQEEHKEWKLSKENRDFFKNIFIHDDIRPFDELDEDTRNKNIVFANAIPNINDIIKEKLNSNSPINHENQ